MFHVLFTGSGSGVGGRSQGRGQIPGKLVTKPLDRFDELTGKDGSLTRHAKTRYHQDAILALDDFKRVCVDQSNRNLDISCQLNESHQLTVEKNHSILVPIVETILLCARQNMALRVHRNESGYVSSDGLDPEENDGNFRALLRFSIRGGDEELKNHAQSAKANATHQSPDIQNALIVAAGDLVKETVISRIKSARFWPIVADETTDRRCREQLEVIARYVKMDSLRAWHCYEEPFAIVDIYALIKDFQPSEDHELRLSAKAIGETLLHVVKRLQLDLAKDMMVQHRFLANVREQLLDFYLKRSTHITTIVPCTD